MHNQQTADKIFADLVETESRKNLEANIKKAILEQTESGRAIFAQIKQDFLRQLSGDGRFERIKKKLFRKPIREKIPSDPYSDSVLIELIRAIDWGINSFKGRLLTMANGVPIIDCSVDCSGEGPIAIPMADPNYDKEVFAHPGQTRVRMILALMSNGGMRVDLIHYLFYMDRHFYDLVAATAEADPAADLYNQFRGRRGY